MRRAVREQVRGGADLIKIMGCHDTLEFTDEELNAVVDETHRNGLKITAHATYDACIRRMLEHDVDTIEHGGPMTDETIELLLQRGTYIVTTFAPVVMQAAEGEAWGVPAWKVQERKRLVDDPSEYDGLVRAARAGVPIAFGTDAGSPVVPHDVIAPELKFMVTGGRVRRQRAGAAIDHVGLGADERPPGRPWTVAGRARRRRRRCRRRSDRRPAVRWSVLKRCFSTASRVA